MRWTDEYGAREFCPLTWTVRIVRPPSRRVGLSPVEEAALADLVAVADDQSKR